MQRLSSQWTWFYKQTFPLFFIAFAVLGIGLMASDLWALHGSHHPVTAGWVALAMTMAMLAIGIWLRARAVKLLVDEVWLSGNDLVMRNAGEELRVALNDVARMSWVNKGGNWGRVNVSFRHTTRFGRNLVFVPADTRSFWSVTAVRSNPTLFDLIQRMNTASVSAP